MTHDLFITGPKDLTFDEFREVNVRRCLDGFKQNLNEWSASDWMMATAGELGELCNLLKKRLRGDSNISDKDIRDEAADTFIYLDLFAASEGFSLAAAAASKFNEVSDRVGSSIKMREV